MQQTFTFKKMNTDVADKFLPQGSYRSMRNCRPNNRNTKSGGVVESIPSTLSIDTISFGENVEYVGGCQDAKRNAIISFYNGDTKAYITSFNTKTKQESFLTKSSLISRIGRITHAIILDDDLYWIDPTNKMRKVRITSCNGTLNQFTAEELLVDKFPPLFPPIVSALEDSTFEGNNITNSIFQFAYAYVYDTKEQSSWSPFSKSVLPSSTSGYDIRFPNNAIDITVNTGTAKVEKILIAYRISSSSDWLLYDTLNKTKLSISNNTTYTYRFYNNKYTVGLDQADVNNYTYNPYYEASTLALSKDNFLIYGKVRDGLTKSTDISLSLSYTVTQASARTASYKMGAVHEFGIIFRDENGRTDGVNARTQINIPFCTSSEIVPDTGSSMRTIASGIQSSNAVPMVNITWSVSGSAPSWAKTMSIVYLGSNTVSSFTDYTLSGIADVGEYTYLDLSALDSLKDTVSVLDPGRPSLNISPYTFTSGDRIRFITDKYGTLLDATDSTDKFDYEIIGSVAEVVDSGGNPYYPNNIYINKTTDWSTYNIGKNSVFEIYSPRKDFKDSIFMETAEVFVCDDGVIMTTSGTLTSGDVYAFRRDMTQYEVGEFIADERSGKEVAYNYPADFDSNYGGVGFSPQLNVLKNATGIQPAAYAENVLGGGFYRNTTGETKLITVTGTYEFTTESSRGYSFILRRSTPSANIQDYIIYTEVHHTDAVTATYKGTINKQIVVPNSQYVSLYFDNADERYARLIIRNAPKIKLSVKITDYPSTQSIYAVESRDYSDYFTSNEHSYGRPFVEVEEDTSWKNQLVISGKYFEGTNINETNKISSLNSKQIPYGFGYLNAIRVKGDTLKIFTPSKEISAYLGKESFVDGAGTYQQSITNTPIGDIRPYDADYGTENPESLLMTSSSIYYYDRKNAAIIQTSQNGSLDIAERYGAKTYLRDVTSRINSSTSYNAFMGYNDKNFEIIIVFVVDGIAETLVFNEVENCFTHYLDYEDLDGNAPRGMMNHGESLLVYLKGKAYLNEQGTGHNTFFGDQKQSSVSFIVNDQPISTKILRRMTYQSDHAWDVSIESEETTAYPKGMKTLMSKTRFKQKEGIYFSDIPKNIKTKSGSINLTGFANGDDMRGRTATVTMLNINTERVQLDVATVDFVGSPVQ